jgi:hypothetical protein
MHPVYDDYCEWRDLAVLRGEIKPDPPMIDFDAEQDRLASSRRVDAEVDALFVQNKPRK